MKPSSWLALALLLVLAGDARGDDALPPDANKMCPVMTDTPSKSDRFVDFQGKRIFFCCDKCVAKFNGAPQKYLVNLPGAAPASVVPASSAAAQPSRYSSHAWQLLGKLHVVVVHFPIALILVAGVIEGVRLRNTTRRPGDVAFACLGFGALAAIVAAGMGWVDAAVTFGNAGPKALTIHRWLGVTLAGAAAVAAMIALAARRWPKPTLVRTYRIAAVVCALWVSVEGHFGGVLTYGSDYYTSIFRSPSIPAPPLAIAPTTTPVASIASNTSPAGIAPEQYQSLIFGSPDDVRLTRIHMRLALVPKPTPPLQVEGSANNDIDKFVMSKWYASALPQAKSPPPLCDDGAFVRRVYLDLIGVIPTIEESKKFLDDKSPAKREKLIDDLLARNDDYAAHWTPFWEEAIASTPFAVTGGIPTHGDYQAWILDSFKTNRPLDVMVAQLIDPTEPGYQKKSAARVIDVDVQPQYIKNATHVDTLQSAANVGQFFLGTEMKCASCHSHFLNEEWPQDRFLGFAGLFTNKDLERIRCEKTSGKFVPAHFAFSLPNSPTTVPTDVNQRLHMATRLITDPANPRFARTAVNRLWKRYLGLGLYEPVDDLREDTPSTNPPLLDWLAYDFIEHGYDLKHTIRLILSSRTYQLKYDPAVEDHFDVAKRTEPRYYRSPSLRRLTAEQLIDSIRVAESQRLEDGARTFHNVASTNLTRALGRPPSRNEISTARPDDVAIVQSLELLNGQEWSNLIYSGSLLSDLSLEKEQAKVVDQLYRAALSRGASADESAAAMEFLKSSQPATQPSTKPAEEEIVWLDDTAPEGAKLHGSSGAESWHWVSKPSPVFSGDKSREQKVADAPIQHYFLGAKPIELSSGEDVFYAYVYLDPKSMPKELILQFNQDGSWEHRGAWGKEILIPQGQDGTESRRRIGPLPKGGKWMRLEVLAKQIGLKKGSKVNGISFDQYSGHAYWDKAGMIKKNIAEQPGLGDVMWTLFTSPEFQYIR